MALIECYECNKNVSTLADKCPHCGAPLRIQRAGNTNNKTGCDGCCGCIMFLFFWVVLGAIFGGNTDKPAKTSEAPLAEKAESSQNNIDYFYVNRAQIMSALKKSLSEKDYQSVISQSENYLESGDKELEQMHSLAKTEKLLAEVKRVPVREYEKNKNLYQQLLDLNPDNTLYKSKIAFYSEKITEEKQMQKAMKTEKLLAELKNEAEQNIEKNKNLYQQLLKLHPDNELYKTKTAFYSEKVAEEEKREEAIKDRARKIKKQFSFWDGAHYGLESLIKESMNDPESYSHVRTTYSDNGDHLVVTTTFRRRNAFGGIVANTMRAKVTLDGNIIYIYK